MNNDDLENEIISPTNKSTGGNHSLNNHVPLAPPQPMINPQTPQQQTTEPIGSPPESSNGPGARPVWRELLSTVSILVTALLIALFIITFVFRSYQVDGPSMETTLQNNDKLIIWKVPRTWASITRHDYIPNRGDVIVFNESGLNQYGPEDSKQLIKRVIGLPGERVMVKDGVITVYNQEHPDGFKPDQELPYGKNIPYTSGSVDVTLDKHQLFVSGDNRPDSLDSRVFGPIDASQVVGKLVMRVFPLNAAEVF